MDIDSVIEKIKKAVRLANRTTSDGERETAMRLAKSLADKNGIAFDQIAAETSSVDKAVKVDDEKRRHYSGVEIGHASYILREHFGVVVMFNRYADGRQSLSWFGSKLNIEIAKFVWHILLRESAKAWKYEGARLAELRKEVAQTYGIVRFRSRKEDAKRKAPFMQGFFWAISQKLKEHPLRNDIEADRKAAERKLEEFRENNKVTDRKARESIRDEHAILAGAKAGSSVNLSRPCEGRGESPLALAM